jgi:hypothetical protein
MLQGKILSTNHDPPGVAQSAWTTPHEAEVTSLNLIFPFPPLVWTCQKRIEGVDDHKNEKWVGSSTTGPIKK